MSPARRILLVGGGVATVGAWLRARLAAEVAVDGTVSVGSGWIVGLGVVLAVMLANYRCAPLVVRLCASRRATLVLGLGALTALALPLTPLGADVRGAQIGVVLPGVGRMVQPVHLGLLGVGLVTAVLLSRLPDDRADALDRYVPLAVFAAMVTAVLAMARDFGPALVALFTIGLLVACTGRRLAVTAAMAVGGGAAGGAAAASSGLVRRRVVEWLEGGSEQVQVGLAAVVDAGWLGHGPGGGRPGVLPLAAQDLTAAALVGDLGLVGLTAILVAWLVVIATGASVVRAADADIAVVAAGVTAATAAQVGVVVAMAAGLLPLSGLPFPLMSTGWSALLSSAAALGLLAGVSTVSSSGHAARRDVDVTPILAAAIIGVVAVVVTMAQLRLDDLDPEVVNRHRALERQVARPLVSAEGAPLARTEFTSGGIPRRQILEPAAFGLVGTADPRTWPRGAESARDRLACRRRGWRAWLPGDGCADPVVLTVESGLQRATRTVVDEAPGGASIVVLDARGRVRAAAATSDPTGVEALLAMEHAGDWVPDPFHRLVPPGSTMKPLVAAAAHPVAAGTYPFLDAVASGSGHVRAWQPQGCGGELLTALIVDSCNPAAVLVARDAGYARVRALAMAAGFSRDVSATGLPVTPAQFPDPDDPWQSDLAAIGQGEVRATVAQQALVAVAVTTGQAPGHLTVLGDDPPADATSVVDDRTVAEVVASMRACVTARACGDGLAGLKVEAVAKTGTAQHARTTFGWCVAAAPAIAPTVFTAARVDPTSAGGATGRDACDLLAPLLEASVSSTSVAADTTGS